MAANSYCQKADVDDIWSEEGVESRFDDDADGSLSAGETSRVDRFIQRASIIVGSKLRTRLNIATFEGSNPPTNTPDSVRYMTAVVAAYYSAGRRGLAVPAEVTEQYRDVMQWLDLIADGGALPIDLIDDFDGTPYVSNFTVDGTYRSSKVRVVNPTSTRDQPTAGIRRARELFIGFPFFD